MNAPGPARVSVIVLTYNKKELLERCLRTLEETVPEGPGFEFIVVDNGSTDGTAALVGESHPRFRLERTEANLGFPGGMNLGMSRCSPASKYLVLLSNDLEFSGDWLSALLETAEADPAVGIVGCRLLYPDGTIQHAGGELDDNMHSYHIGQHRSDDGSFGGVAPMTYVTGAVWVLRRKLYDAIGGFDPGFCPYLYEDVDLCLRARRAGFKVMYDGRTRIIHHESTTIDPVKAPAVLSVSFRNHLRFLLLNFRAGRLVRSLPRAMARDLFFMAGKGQAGVPLRGWLAAARSLPSILGKRKRDAAKWPLLA
jgi:GT2 family glycosyltransferase